MTFFFFEIDRLERIFFKHDMKQYEKSVGKAGRQAWKDEAEWRPKHIPEAFHPPLEGDTMDRHGARFWLAALKEKPGNEDIGEYFYDLNQGVRVCGCHRAPKCVMLPPVEEKEDDLTLMYVCF